MQEITKDRIVNAHRIAMTFHDAGGKNIVIFCHGFRSSNIGPNRFFVQAARRLTKAGISSLRFDQYGSGNSEGDFFDSSFNNWIKTITTIAAEHIKDGNKVALFGQSMGGAAVIAVASDIPELAAVVAWSPDPNVEPFAPSGSGTEEEGGQIIQDRFWQEAHDARVAEKLALVKAPAYIVQCTNDEYVDEENRDAIARYAQVHHIVETFEGYLHSKWTFAQAEGIIEKSTSFLARCFQETEHPFS